MVSLHVRDTCDKTREAAYIAQLEPDTRRVRAQTRMLADIKKMELGGETMDGLNDWRAQRNYRENSREHTRKRKRNVRGLYDKR